MVVAVAAAGSGVTFNSILSLEAISIGSLLSCIIYSRRKYVCDRSKKVVVMAVRQLVFLFFFIFEIIRRVWRNYILFITSEFRKYSLCSEYALHISRE